MATALADNPTQGLTRALRRMALLPNAGGMPDGELLERYLADRDEAAFEVLVRRHGPMVLGVCRRVLRDPDEAEDAFQAVFMVLIRKAESIVPRGMVGNWLYGVANRTALKARAVRSRVDRMERQVDAMPEIAISQECPWPDLMPLLDRELTRLPDEYRVAVVLCDLEGKSRCEAAEQLGVPEGTVSSRLARGRNLLKQRLLRRGLTLSVAAIATAFTQNQAMAAVSQTLVASTVQTASLISSGASAAGIVSAKVAALAEGVIRAMFITKLKIVASIALAIGILTSGAGFVTHQALAQKNGKPAAQDGKKGESEFIGVVRAVDAAGQTISIGGKLISSGGKTVIEKSFPLAPDIKVLLDNGTGDESAAAAGKLADLTEGTMVTLRVGSDQKVASIRADGPTVQGVVDSVNVAANSIQVTIRPGKGDPEHKTLAVAPNARISIADGKAGKTKEKTPAAASMLADLPIGSHVTLKLSADRQTVGSISAEGPTVRGTVKSVDSAAGTIALAVQEGKQSVEKSFNVKNASVTIADAVGKSEKGKVSEQKLADLPVGAVVTLRLSPSQEVLSVSAEGPSVSGFLKQVDAVGKRITLVKTAKGETDRELDFPIAADAHVTIDGTGDRTLGDLPIGVSLTVRLSADQKTVRGIDAEGPSIQGTATIVDSSSRRITVNEKVAENIYQLTADTQIAIDGKSGDLNSVPVGAVIRAKLTADRTTIRHLAADGPSVRGKLTGVDTANHSVTVYVAKEGDKVFDLAQDARVATEVYGVALKIGDLQLDKEVSLMLTADRKKVSRITVHGE